MASNWKNLDALPTARYNAGVASFRNWIYVAGGSTNFAQSSVPLTILKTRVDTAGNGPLSSSPWLSCAPDFTIGKIAPVLLVNQGHLILLGGRGASATAAQTLTAQDIYVGKIDADGNVPRWTVTTGGLPAPMLDMGVVVKDDYLYLLGGSRANLSLDYDNQLVNFVAASTVVGITSRATATIYSDTDGGAAGTLVLKDAVGDFLNNEEILVEHATVAAVLTPVATTSFYLDYDTGTGAFTIGQVVTGAGGATGTLTVNTTADAGATGTLTLTGVSGTFVDGEAITDPITGAAKVAAGTVKYKTLGYSAQTANFAAGQIIWGGTTAAATGTVMSDTDAGTTGTLKVKLITSAFVLGEKICVDHATADLAATATSTSLNTCYRARLGPDGSIGAFTLLSVAAPASGDLRGACEVVGDRVFVANATELYSARIGPDGIGPWTTAVPGFSKVSHSLLRVQGDKLIAVGGYTGSTTTATVYETQINSSGDANPVSWHQTQPLSIGVDSGAVAARRRHGLTRIGNRLFVIGGVDTNNLVLASCLGCTLDPAGTIGGI